MHIGYLNAHILHLMHLITHFAHIRVRYLNAVPAEHSPTQRVTRLPKPDSPVRSKCPTMRHLLKVIVGGILMLNFSATVVIIGLNQSLRSEPVAMFVTNLALTDFSFSLMLFLIGLSDVVFVPPVPAPVCITLQYLCLSSAWALKVAQLVMVLDMFVAVVYPLHYHQLMDVWMKPMLAAPWLSVLTAVLIGVVCSALRLENSYEYGLRVGGLTQVGTDCRWELLPSVWAFLWEAGLFLLATVSGGIFIYASVVGLRQRRAIEDRGEETAENRAFFLRRFKSLQKIAKVILLFIAFDIIGALARISARWYYLPLLTSAIHFVRMTFIAVETWVYGMNNVSLRNAYSTFYQEHFSFLRRNEQVRPEVLAAAPERVIRPSVPPELPSLEGSRPIAWTQ